MKAGDPKQTVVLSVVAVVVLGVAVVRILPKKGSSIAAVARAQEASRAAKASVAVGMSTLLRSDPFYHPALRVAKIPTGPTLPLPPNSTLPKVIPPDWAASIGVRVAEGAMEAATGDTKRGSPGDSGGIKTEENTGPSQQVRRGHQVVVNAILTVSKPLAYISVDGEEARLGIGDDLHGLGKIVSISSRAVVVKTRTGKVTLIVGEPKKL